MPAGGAAARADALGADAETGRVVAHKPDGALGVIDGRRVAEARCLAVIDREDRVATSLHRCDVWQAQRRLLQRARVVTERRMPAAAVDVDDAKALWMRRTIDVHE